MKKIVNLVALLCTSVALTGCMGGSGGEGSSFLGRMTSISIVDSSERIKLDTRISLSDIIAFAENLTNKMLQSSVFANAKRPPRIIITAIRNNTHDENLRVKDVHDRIMEVLFNSGQVRILDESATRFDYVMQSELTDIITRSSDGQKLVDYSMKIKLYDLNGEIKGTWSDDLSLFKNR